MVRERFLRILEYLSGYDETLALMHPKIAGESDSKFAIIFIHSHIWTRDYERFTLNVLSMFRRLLPPHTFVVIIINISIFTIMAFFVYIMSDSNKDVAMAAEENMDGENVSGQASQCTWEAGDIAATEERGEDEGGEEEKKKKG